MTLKNIMPKEPTDDHLLSYEKYFNLEGRFNNTYTEYDGLDQQEFLNNTPFNIKNGILIRQVFEKLLKLIRNRTIFIDNQDNACSYISYIFSKEVQSKVPEYEPQIFEMFQKFVHRYNSRPGHTSYVCPNHLLYVNSNMYVKMNKLYTLYELYKNHREKNNTMDNPKNCPPFSLFLIQYNEFIRNNQPTNKHYKNILELFEKDIKSDAKTYKQYACPDYIFHPEEIKFHTLSENKRPEALDQAQQQKKNLQDEVSTAKGPLSHEVHQASPATSLLPEVELPATSEDPGTSFMELQTHHKRHERPLARLQTPQEGRHSSHQTLAHSSHTPVGREVQGPPQGETHERDLPMGLSSVYTSRNGSLETSRKSLHSERYEHSFEPPSSNEVGDTSSTVMGTITSALRDVEPGPVLVVSGGMGVLFLLFKYTPVGSFFGGRRGRFRQIPRTFGGFPPGDFGNFQEYGGGYVGYSQMDMPFQGE